MQIRSLFRAFLAIITFTVAAQANAAVLQVNSNGLLIGAKGVSVQGKLYDVTFVGGNCLSNFNGCDAPSDFMFHNSTDAIDAGNALLSQVFIDSTLGNFDTQFKTFNCSNMYQCYTFIPYSSVNSAYAKMAIAMNFFGANSHYDTTSLSDFSSTLEFGGRIDVYNYAKFEAAATTVPEPSSIALFGLAVAGLALNRRRKVCTKSSARYDCWRSDCGAH